MFHILTSADTGRTKIREDKMRDQLLQCIRSGHLPGIVFNEESDIHWDCFSCLNTN